MLATIVATLPANVVTSTPKRILTPPNLSPEDKLARWERLSRNQERHNAYGRGYAAGQRAERKRMLRLLGK
jgi:hypothetical protein